MMRIRRLAVALVLATGSVGLGASACGSGTAPAPASSVPVASVSGPTSAPVPAVAPSARCGPPAVAAQAFTLYTDDGVALAAAEAGAGPRGVVLIHEYGNFDMCGWWDYAAYLAGHGFHTLLFDHRCSGRSACPTGTAAKAVVLDIAAAAARLRTDGAAKVIFLGASRGATEALITAAVPGSGVAGVVALSADLLGMPVADPPYPPTGRAAAPQVHVPALFAVAAADRYVTVGDTRALVDTLGSADRQLVEVPGVTHGWDLVATDPNGQRPPLSATVVDFLQRVTAH